MNASPIKKNIQEETPKHIPVLSSSMKELETIKQLDEDEKFLLKQKIHTPPPQPVFISFNKNDIAPEPDVISPIPQDFPKKLIHENTSFFENQKLANKSMSVILNKNWKKKEILVGNSRSAAPKKSKESAKDIFSENNEIPLNP